MTPAHCFRATMRRASLSLFVLVAFALASFGCVVPSLADDRVPTFNRAHESGLESTPPMRYDGDVSACPAGFEDGVPAGQNEGFEAGGQTRSFLLVLPDDIDDTPRPLFLGFNGTGQSGAEVFDGWELQTFVDAGFVVLLPDSNANGSLWPVWDALHQPGEDQSDNPDLAFVDALVDCVAAHHPIDAHRMYAGGHSAGGIMTSHFLRSRSDVFAGGIIASGMSDLTDPNPVQPIDPLSVVVTWGGMNDTYGGGSEDPDVSVPEINFVEQAALNSQFWEAKDSVHQIHCVGDDLGHTWLDSANHALVDFLLAHPKGTIDNEAWRLRENPSEVVSCSEAAASYTTPVAVECALDESEACRDYCQLIGNCVVENSTAAPVLGPQLTDLGFAGDGLDVCGGCVSTCQADASSGSEIDDEVLSCFQQTDRSTCGGGVDGFMPFVEAANTCCDGRLDSEVCSRLCASVRENDIAIQLVTACEAF